jgi:hypothetical protein
MWLRISEFTAKQLMFLSNSFTHVILLIIFLIQPDPLRCSELNDYRKYSSSITNENQHPTPPVLLKSTRYESSATLPSQEEYDVEHTGKSSDIEEYQSIMNHKSSVENKQDEFSQEISTAQNPIVNRHKGFSSEFSTIHDIRNGDNEFSTEFSTIHDVKNGDNEFVSEFSTRQYIQNLSTVSESREFSSGFSTVQTETSTEENSILSNELAEAKRIQQSPLTSNGSLNKTLSSKEDEIKYVLNIENLTAYFTAESSNDYSEFIDDNLINFVDENSYCRGYDLSVNFECLKQKLMQRIRYLTSQKAPRISDTVHQLSYPVAETR